jgi:cellobiose-specific phosphotransferase system component IIC
MENHKNIIYFIAGWLLFQFIVIGIVSAWQYNQIVKRTYDCSINETVPEPFGAIFPLVAFVPDSAIYQHYCEGQWPVSKAR